MTDVQTADAYGRPHDLSDEQILEKLAALNARLATETAAGRVRRWRHEDQIPHFAKSAAGSRANMAHGSPFARPRDTVQ